MNENPDSQGNWLGVVTHALLRELHHLGHGVVVASDAVIGWAWTPLAILVVIVAAFLGWVSYAHRQWKKDWLSQRIAERLSAIKKERVSRKATLAREWWHRGPEFRLIILEKWDDLLTYFRDKFINQLTTPYIPSVLSFSAVAVIIAVFFFIPRPPPFVGALHWHWQDWRRFLTDDLSGDNARTEGLIVGAFTGLVVIIIALIVFVAESIRDDKDFERKRVLIQISFLWPLAVAATLIPFGFLWSASRGLTILLELIVAGFTLVSFARVVRALLNPEVRASDRLRWLSDRVRRVMSDSANERIGNTILLEQLGSGKRIDTFHYLSSSVWIEDEPNHFVHAIVDGWIEDIQLDELRKLGDRLDRYARENLGFALRKSGPELHPATSSTGSAASPVQEMPEKKAYLLKRYREEIPSDPVFDEKRRYMFALPEAFAQSPAILADIQATIAHAFRFTKQEPSSIAMRREMQGTKDQLAQAIRDHALGEIGDLRQLYLEIAKIFLKMLLELGGGYTAEQAQKERGNYFESWAEIRWLTDDLRELIIIAADAGNIDALSSIAFLPFGIAIRAVQAGDHFLFQQFYQFASVIYAIAIERAEGSPIRSWMIEKSWRWPKEIAEFYISRALEARTNSPNDLERMRGFAFYSLRVFQDLLKLMADKRDLSAFSAAAHELRRLYRRFRAADDHPSVDLLRLQLSHVENDDQRTSLLGLIERQEKRLDVSRALSLAIDEIFLALGGRVLAQRIENPGNPQIEGLLDAITKFLPGTIQRLAETYAAASDMNISDAWGWNLWDSIADGQAHWVDTHTKLNQIFSVRALQLLAALSPDARANIELPTNESLATMAKETNPQGVLATLNAIEANPERWRPVLDEEARSCINVLRALLAAAVAAEQKQAAERTRDATLDPAKVAAFRDELVRSFLESGRLRHLLDAKGARDIDLSKSPGAPVRSLGFSQLDDKNAFIAQENVDYGGWGRGYGQGIAQGEDEETFVVMIGAAKTKHAIVASEIVASIDNAVASQRDPIVLLTLDFDVRYPEVDNNSAFTPKYAPGIDTEWRDYNGFMGFLTFGARQIPVFDVHVQRSTSENHILVLDAKHFLRWHQYAPSHEPDEQSYADGQLLIHVVDLNANVEKRDEIIAQNPPWLADESSPVEYLRGRVLVNVYEKFDLEILDASQCVCLTVPQ